MPPQVMYASTTPLKHQSEQKDSVSNIRETGVFCVNIVEYAARDVMNVTSDLLPPDTDEFELAGVARNECETIACSRVVGAPASLECKVSQIVELAGDRNYMVIGEVTGIHMRDDCLVDGMFDVTRYQPLARMGYRDYTVVKEVFTLKRPGE